LTTAIEQTLETYGIENWGAGYFDVNRKGNLIVRPTEGDSRSADLKEIIDDLAGRGIGAPGAFAVPTAGRGTSQETSTRIQSID
jgi:arginine decarboxylase